MLIVSVGAALACAQEPDSFATLMPMGKPLRCYLLKTNSSPTASVETPVDTELVSAQVMLHERLHEINAVSGSEEITFHSGDLFVLLFSSLASSPWWQSFFAAELSIPSFALSAHKNQGALVFCAVTDPVHTGQLRWVVWTFGSGSRFLIRRAIEPRFGVVCALNRLVSGQLQEATLRKLQYNQQGAFRQRTGHVAYSDTPLGGFRMDQVRDLLAAVGGKPTHAESQIFGGRHFFMRGDVPSLGALAHEAFSALQSYMDTTYRDSFSFIDDYMPVNDPTLEHELDKSIQAACLAMSDHVDVALPLDVEDFSGDSPVEYILFPNEQSRSRSRRNVTIDVVQMALHSGKLDIDSDLRFVDADGHVLARESLRGCLAGEVELEGQQYCLVDGTYFNVRKEFLQGVDAELTAMTNWSMPLPGYGGGKEGSWLEAVYRFRDFIVMDGWCLKLPGRTAVEAADILHTSGAFIHAKRKGRSSSLSYLFAQAVNSIRLLGESPDAVEQLRDEVSSRASGELRDRVLASLVGLDKSRPGLDVVFAILGDWHNKTVCNLPLIAKLELRAALNEVRHRGFQPRLALVSLTSRS